MFWMFGSCACPLQVFRQQQTDTQFLGILGRARNGDMSADDVQVLLHAGFEPPEGLLPTMLYCRTMDVSTENLRRLAALPGTVHTVPAQDSGLGPYGADLDGGPLLKLFVFKIGAQVMHVLNLHGLRNGSRGVVVAVSRGFPVVRFVDGTISTVFPFEWTAPGSTSTRRQVPLVLAWAVTIHKCQGLVRARRLHAAAPCRVLPE